MTESFVRIMLIIFLCMRGLNFIFHRNLASNVLELHKYHPPRGYPLKTTLMGGYFAQIKSTALQQLATL